MMPTVKTRLCNLPDSFRQAGFNLVEMIVVIAITGILSAAVAVFIKGPISGFIDTTRRAELTDIADTALRRMGRDLHLALPNSVRVRTDAGGSQYMEFLQAPAGARYREDGSPTALDFTITGPQLQTFDYFGPPLNAAPYNVVPGWWVVVYNLGIPQADAYNNDNISPITAITASQIQINSPHAFPFESSGQRFQIVDTPVTYKCDAVTGRLMRYWGYGIQPSQPMTFASGSSARLAGSTNASVINCGLAFTYTSGVTDRSGLVEIRLDVRNTASNELVSLYYEVHVNNVP